MTKDAYMRHLHLPPCYKRSTSTEGLTVCLRVVRNVCVIHAGRAGNTRMRKGFTPPRASLLVDGRHRIPFSCTFHAVLRKTLFRISIFLTTLDEVLTGGNGRQRPGWNIVWRSLPISRTRRNSQVTLASTTRTSGMSWLLRIT